MYIACAPGPSTSTAPAPDTAVRAHVTHMCVTFLPGVPERSAKPPTARHTHTTATEQMISAHRVEGEEGGREVLVTSGERRGRQRRRAEERAAGRWEGRRGWQESPQLHVQGVWLPRRGLLLWQAGRQRTRRRHRQAQQQHGGHPDARRRRRNLQQSESSAKMTGSRMGLASRDQLP